MKGNIQMKKIKKILLAIWVFFIGSATKIYGKWGAVHAIIFEYGMPGPRVSPEEKKNIILMVVKRINFIMLGVMTFTIGIIAFLIAFNKKTSNRKKIMVFLIIVVLGVIATLSLFKLISSNTFYNALVSIIDNNHRDEYMSEKNFVEVILNDIRPNTIISFLIIGLTFLIITFLLLSERLSRSNKKDIIVLIIAILVAVIFLNIVFFEMSRK